MLLYSINIVSKVSIIRSLIKALSLIGLFLFEGGSAQFAGGFIISISSMVPGGFYLASFAMMGFLRRVLNYLSSTWNDFWYRNRSWCNRICVVIPKGMIFPRPNNIPGRPVLSHRPWSWKEEESKFWTVGKISKAVIWFYFFLFQTAAALFSYFMFAFVFFLFNRIGLGSSLDRLTNMNDGL